MKNPIVLACLLVVLGTSAMAFDPTPARGNRIGILNTARIDDDPVTLRVASLMRRPLGRELRNRGFEAFDTRVTMDELVRGAEVDADYFVEFIAGDTDDRSYAGIGIGSRNGVVDMNVVGSSIDAALRLYDGRTLEVIDEFDVHADNKAFMPTAIGVGGRHTSFWVGLPVQILRHRGIARKAAYEAAEIIAGALEPELVRE